LICSGSSISDAVSQAQVAKSAAMLLGVDSTRIITLDTPATTKEEAAALREKVGTNALVVIVTDAIHMPRAVKLFSEQGLRFVAAPTNFKVLQTAHDLSVKWWPSGENIYLMDLLLHEYLGNLKNVFSSF